jgi:hypothetical protein
MPGKVNIVVHLLCREREGEGMRLSGKVALNTGGANRGGHAMIMRRPTPLCGLVAVVVVLATMLAYASSHREAPLITETPKVDGTDFYMFRSYEAGRENFVTIIAN